MSAPLRHPVIPAGVVRQETATCDRFGGTCCPWSCCKAPIKRRAQTVELSDRCDLDIPESLLAAFPGTDIVTLGRINAALKERADNASDLSRHRQAWEA